MELPELTRRHIEAITLLLTTPDRGSVQQGIELAKALGDEAVFAALLDGVEVPQPSEDELATMQRWPALRRNEVFEGPRANRAWLDLALVHVVAASDLPLRSEVTAIAIGSPGSPQTAPPPVVWLAGLERLESLTHLDLYLPGGHDVDLRPLSKFPSLTHLRIRGSSDYFRVPSHPELERLEGGRLELDSASRFPKLQSISGQLRLDDALTPDMMPTLRDIDVRMDVRVRGFKRLGTVLLRKGNVELFDCRSIEHIRPEVGHLHAPQLHEIGTLDGACPGIDVSNLTSLGSVRITAKGRFSGGTFPEGARALDGKAVVWGPALEDIGNIGELIGLEELAITRVTTPQSLDTLRHAKDLRVLDIRNSTGIWDLSPLIGLPKLEVIIAHGSGVTAIPEELAHVVSTDASTRIGRAAPIPVDAGDPAADD